MKVEDCIFYQLSKANQAASRFLSERLSVLDLTAVQGVVLNVLSQGDAISSRELGQRTKLDSATLTGILDRLEARGLLDRRPNPEDRRGILICLTGKGRKIAAGVRDAVVKANRDLLGSFGVKEQAALRRMLNRIHEEPAAP